MSSKREEWHTKLVPGQCYLFTDATSMIYVGRLVRIDGPHDAVLEEASWVSNTGRLHEFVRDGKANSMEIEPVGERAVHWVGWSPWKHPLFTKAV